MKPAKLNLFDLTMIVVSLVIGMGIFRTPVNVAREAGSPAMFFLAWIMGGIVALCGALTYAEIGSRYPVTGGYYRIFSYGYHPSIAFAINCIILVSNAGSMAGVALIGSEYFSNIFFPGHANKGAIELAISIFAILFFYGVNLLGLKMSARTQNVLTIIKIALVVLLIGALFTVSGHATDAPAALPMDTPGPLALLKAFGACLVAVSFTYGGYQQTINFGGEVGNASKILPRGIFLGISIIMLLYLSINYTYYKVIGFNQLKTSESIAAILAANIFGSWGFMVLSMLLFLSVLAYVNVQLMSNPRVMFAMSEEGVLPPAFKKLTSRSRVMLWPLTAFACFGIVTLFYAKTFDEIMNYTIFLDSIGMATSAATVFMLRKRKKQEAGENGYSMKLFPLMPIVFIGTYAFIATSIAINTPKAAWVSTLIFTIFFALYFLLKFLRKTPLK